MTQPKIPGIKVLLQGGSGSGKTYAIRTLIQAGITPMCIFTENSFDVLADVPPDKLHWVYVSPMAETLDGLNRLIQQMGNMSYEQMTKYVDPMRGQNNRFFELMKPMMKFVCQRTGEDFGNISTWGTDKCLVLDSLSGLSIAAVKLITGERPAMAQPDYGMAQNAIENLLNQLCFNIDCHLVVTAHIEREKDEVSGGTKVMPATVGAKLAPKLPRFFTDVIFAKRAGAEFFWDTADPTADLKARNAPISGKLPASFVPLIQAWQARVRQAGKTTA